MVVSKINKRINYPELNTIPHIDVKKTLELYQIEVQDIEIVIAIGTPNKDFEDNDIIYYPIYLVNKENKVIQIGVYEIESNQFVSMYSDDNELIIDNFDDALIYSFVNKQMLNDIRLKPDFQMNDYDYNDDDDAENQNSSLNYKSKVVSSKIYKIPAERQNIFTLASDAPPEIELISEERKEDAKDITDKYHFNESDLWIQKCMKNKLYNIQDVEANGDCFFATIRDAFASIGQTTTVLKLRKRLSEEVTQDMFQTYSELFLQTSIEAKENKDALKSVNENIKRVAEAFKNTLNIDEKRKLSAEATKLKSEKQRIANEVKLAISLLNEYKFMKGVNSIEKLKAKIMKTEYWADDWAVSTIEPIFNIKLILLSSEEFNNSNSCDMILNCGQINTSLLRSDVFIPEFYIILEYTGNHYKLVNYKNKSLFKFKEIPYDIKMLIISKCLEKNSGSFSYIPDFISLQNSMPNISNKPVIENVYTNTINGNLYDDDIVLAFNINSTNKKLPGKGIGGEMIPEGKVKEFSEIHAIEQWRNKLSNMWVQEFILDDHKWSSVEHYYQASKFKRHNPEFYLTFSLDSGTEMARNPEIAKGAGSHGGKHKGKLIRPTNIKIDDKFDMIASKVLFDSQKAKFTQNEDLKQLLLATKHAKLTQWVRGKPNVPFTELMHVRDEMYKQMN